MEEMNDKVEYEKRWCKYTLTEDELSAAANTLALKTQELEEVEAEKKGVATRYKERMESIQADIRKAASLYKDRYEMRDIECIVERDYETGEIRYRRTDTYEVAARDKMTMGERQRRIDDMLPPNNPLALTDEEIIQKRETERMMTSEKSAL